MVLPISWLSGALYHWPIKPILFKIHPDKAHAGMVSVGSVVQKAAPLRGLMRGSWDYENPEMLSQTLNGIYYKNPLGLSAGLDKNAEIVGVCAEIGFGQSEVGSLTFKKCVGNDRPWFYRLPKTKSIVVHVGLANQGAPRILRRVDGYNPRRLRDMRLNVSVAYTNERQTKNEQEAIADYIGSLKLIKEYRGEPKIDIVTLNISCPNTYGGEPFNVPAKLNRLLKQVEKIGLEQPIFIKMPIDKTPAEFGKLLDVCAKYKCVKGLTISNLFKDRTKAELADDLPIHVLGNLSGRPTFEASNQLIALAYRKYGKRFVISGVGGVFSAEDAYAKIRAGASLAQMVTGLMFEGPQIVGQINRGLVKLLKRDGFAHVSEAIGADANKH